MDGGTGIHVSSSEQREIGETRASERQTTHNAGRICIVFVSSGSEDWSWGVVRARVKRTGTGAGAPDPRRFFSISKNRLTSHNNYLTIYIYIYTYVHMWYVAHINQV